MAVKIEDVVKAAQELEKQGVVVTNQSVRKHLGNFGSFTTINAGLRQWRDMKYERRREGQKDFVLTIEEVLDLPAISKAALQHARKEFEDESAAAQAQIDAVEMELVRAGDKIDRLEKTLSDTEEMSKKWREYNDELRSKAAVLEERLTNMAARMEDLEKQVEQAVDAKAVAERALFYCEERLKLADEQTFQQHVQIKELEKGDESVEETAEVVNLALKRVKQVSRLVERLKIEHDDKAVVKKVVAEIQAVADRHKIARKPVKS